MPTRDELETALRNADSAGDTEAATQLATALRDGQYDQSANQPINQPVNQSGQWPWQQNYRPQNEMASRVVDKIFQVLGPDNTISLMRGLGSISGQAEQAKEMPKNIPGSAYNYGSGMAQAIAHPIETAKTVTRLGAGELQKITSDPIKEFINQYDMNPEESQKSLEMADRVNQFYKDRYGSIEGFRDAITKDPVGVMADMSIALGVAGKMSKTAKTFSQAVDPTNVAAKTALTPVKVVAKADKKLYQSAIKMPQKVGRKQLTPMDRAQIAATGLENGIVPNKSGYVKLLDKMDDVNSQISKSIRVAGKAGEKIKTTEIVKSLDDMKDFYKNTFDPKPFLDQIDELKQGVISTHGDAIPLVRAQKIKQNTYRLLRKQYGEMKSVAIEGQKQLARGVKEEIARLHPEIDALNKTDTALIQLEEVIGKAVNRITNRDIMGIGIPAKAAMGAGVDLVSGTGGTATGAGLIAGVLDIPTVKARLAIALNKASRIKGKIPGEMTRNIAVQSQQADNNGR